MTTKQKTIKVMVDKSHLLTLGEKMYIESIELIRELVNNAYDADATKVYITISPEKILVEDDGSGMSRKGLEQFFTVGSEEKRIHTISPRFGRKRIGQFGIGKFAALSAADQFKVQSRKGKWIYEVIFDREDWQRDTIWELPISSRQATPLDCRGTKVILEKLKKKFNLSEVERYLKETIPLRAKKFSVYLNGKLITPKFVPGRTIPIDVKTLYGPIEGEIIIAVSPKLVDQPGIECRVKQVLIKREFFDLDKKPQPGLAKICGWVNADFLPITAGRNDFIQDSAEYKLFYQIMKKNLEKILKELRHQMEMRNLKKISRELREILNKIRQALILNPELLPSGRTITELRKRIGSRLMGSVIMPEVKETKIKEISVGKEAVREKLPSKEKKLLIELPKPQVIKKIRIKKLGISCGIVSLGEEGPEVISQGNMIYINQDHKIYQKLYSKKDLFNLHLLRLLSQEIVMMKKIRLPAREAFNWQSRLLTDAIT
ncbi:MAG: ATP-binding protein [Patescibacteria group bacterium]|nr:ATP-binding protein [Patescibacteria group bacterium]